MTNHVSFSEKPEPVTFVEFKNDTEVTIVINIAEVVDPIIDSESDEITTHWEGDQYIFWETTANVNRDAIIAEPEAFINYVPLKYKNELKDQAQKHLDSIREHTHRVDVPTYKEGYAVMHRPKDDINLLAGLVMGGLPYYEFADGQTVAPLSPEDIQKIYMDVAAHEVKIQQDKQACWAAIDAAATHEEADAALAEYIKCCGKI